jgi:acetyl esterase/lipase
MITVRYTEPRRGIAPLADIYTPHAPRANVLLVHGGGLVVGSRRMRPMRILADRFVREGAAVCSIDYRMMFRGGRLDEAVEDVRAALAFWTARVGPTHVVGLSFGATLSMLAVDASVASLACCFGLYDVAHLPRLYRRMVRWRFDAHPPIPTLLVHGDADRLVPVEQARRLAAHRAALALPTQLVVVPGAPHGFFTTPHAETGIAALCSHVIPA